MFTHLFEKVCKNKLVRRIVSVALVLATVLCVNGIVFAKTVSTDGTYSAHVDYLTVIDGKWEVVATQDKLHRQGNNYKDRYYVTEDELEEAYGEFGFSAQNYNGELYFPHTDRQNYDTLWADASPYEQGGKCCVPLSFRSYIYVYYVPNNSEGNKSYFNTNKKRDDETLISENNFYTVSVSDPEGKEISGTGNYFVLNGNEFSATVKYEENYPWKALNMDTGEKVTYDKTQINEDKITYTFNSVNCPLKLSRSIDAETSCVIEYNAATLEDSFVKMGDIATEQQSVITDGAIKGASSYTENWTEGFASDYILKHPDEDRVFASIPSSSKGKKYYYHFAGWKAGAANKIVAADSVFTARDILRYELNGKLTLDALWTPVDLNGRIISANFYLNINCEIADFGTNGFNSNSENNFTKSIYTTSFYGTDNISVPSSGNLNYTLLAPPTKESSAYETDAVLRNMTTTAYNGVTAEDFPSDEDVFEKLRSSGYVIKMDGVVIPNEKLTSEHFKIRWYVAKYEKSDGWHIDGTLVAREGTLKVTSTFSGDKDAINDVTSGDYEISVLHTDEDKKSVETKYSLTLNPLSEETREGKIGYYAFDETSGTYTWIIKGHPLEYYTLKQENCSADGNWQHLNKYMISKSDSATEGWLSYEAAQGVNVRMESYPGDVPDSAYQTVSFENTYAQTGLLTITKQDSFSGIGLQGVCFKLTDENGNNIENLYRKPDFEQYFTGTDAPAFGYTQKVTDGKVCTGNNGNIYINLPAGQYVLQEEMPTGYDGAFKIVITTNNEGIVTGAQAYNEDAGNLNDISTVISGVGTAFLNVKNFSEQLLSVTAQADWGTLEETPEGDRKNAKAELWCNGAKMLGSKYTQELTKENNYTYVWNDLLLFVDGNVAKYTLRETMIADTAYDSDVDADGYGDYIVSYDEVKYREGDSGGYNDLPTWVDGDSVRHYARHALLKVNNRNDGGRQAIFVAAEWKDAENTDGLRTENLIVRLMKNGIDSGEDFAINKNNGWSCDFGNLKKYENGRKLNYTVLTDVPDGYALEIHGNAEDGFTLVFTHEPEKFDISGKVEWEGDENALNERPQSVEITLLANGKTVNTVNVSENENWSFTFTGLLRKDRGNIIAYSIKQKELQDYDTTITGFEVKNVYSKLEPIPTPTPTKSEEPAPTPTKSEEPAPTPTKSEEPAPTASNSPAPVESKKPSNNVKPPKTGDGANVNAWVIIAAAAGAVAAAAIILLIVLAAKKKKQNK